MDLLDNLAQGIINAVKIGTTQGQQWLGKPDPNLHPGVIAGFAKTLYPEAPTPVSTLGQFDKEPNGEARDAGAGNVWAFKNGTRLARPAGNPLSGNEFNSPYQPSQNPGTMSGMPLDHPLTYSNNLDVSSPTAQVQSVEPPWLRPLIPQAQAATVPQGDWKSTLSPSESWILQHESGLNPSAQNPTSTAFGIWQGLKGTREAYGKKLGIDPNTTDPNQQLLMFREYVKERYGTPEAAQAFWQKNGYY